MSTFEYTVRWNETLKSIGKYGIFSLLKIPNISDETVSDLTLKYLCKGIYNYMNYINNLLQNEHPHFTLLKRIGSISDNQEKTRSSYTH